MKLTGRKALVTGGGRGIGKAIALALASNGADVAVNWFQSEKAVTDTVEEISHKGGKAIAVRADVRQEQEVHHMIETVVEALGGVDILVNNAGSARDSYVAFTPSSQWREMLETNLTGAFLCLKAVTREMMRKKWGRVINISSDAGLMGDMMRAGYSAAKAGLLGLTKTAARELAPYNITVNAIAPGYIETDMLSQMGEAKRKTSVERIPLGRFGRPEEIASVVLFLASDHSSYITGEVLCVDGGLRM